MKCSHCGKPLVKKYTKYKGVFWWDCADPCPGDMFIEGLKEE